MLFHGIALTQNNGERLNHMEIYPTYTSDTLIDGTVIIDGLVEYYSGSKKCMRRLSVIPSRCLLDDLTRIKPYVHLPHIQI